MRPLLHAALILPFALSLAAADAPQLERITLADGRVLEGVVDEAAKTIQLWNMKTGKPLATLPLKPADIAKREPLEAPAHATEDDKPKTKRGADGKWLTSHPVAVKLAKETNRLILANFTGSDWCPWCVKLQKEIFSTPAFRAWAAENVVLLEIDFPNAEQAPQLKTQNAALKQQYGVSGFPSVLVIDGAGKSLGKTGYLKETTPDGWIENLGRIVPALQRK